MKYEKAFMSLAEKNPFELPITLTLDQAEDVAHQQTATTSLERLRKEQVYDLPNYGQSLAHNGRITNFSGDDLAEGLYLDDEFRDEIFANGKIPDRLGFQTDEMQRIGKEDSKRHVFFGEARLDYFDARRDPEPISVALKPFEGQVAQKHGLQEIAVSQYLGLLGLGVIKPVGLLVGPGESAERTIFMVSKTDDNLKSLDNIDWAKIPKAKVIDHIDGAVSALATVNSRLVFQGDALLRNTAMRQTKDNYLTVDYEYAISTRENSHPSSAAPLRTKQAMSADLSALATDIKDRIYRKVEGGNETEAFEWLLQHVYMPYRRHLIEADGHYTAMLVQCFDVVLLEHTQQTFGEWSGRQSGSRFGLVQ
jgi:hypothetical protein